MPVILLPDPSPSSARVAVTVAVLALLVLGAAGTAAMWLSAADEHEPVAPPLVTAKPVERDRPTDAPNQVQAADLGAVDALTIIEQATALARKHNPKAKLTQARFRELKGGLLDLNGGSRARLDFEFFYVDPNKPTGKDMVKGTFSIDVRHGALGVSRERSLTRHLHRPDRTDLYPLPGPRCGSKDAFETAVRSGVPRDTVARLVLERKRGRGALQWTLFVDDHDELRRVIDAMTCKLASGRGSNARSRARPRPAPKSKPVPAPERKPAGKTVRDVPF